MAETLKGPFCVLLIEQDRVKLVRPAGERLPHAEIVGADGKSVLVRVVAAGVVDDPTHTQTVAAISAMEAHDADAAEGRLRAVADAVGRRVR